MFGAITGILASRSPQDLTVFKGTTVVDVPVSLSTLSTTFYTDAIVDVPVVVSTLSTAFSTTNVTDVPITLTGAEPIIPPEPGSADRYWRITDVSIDSGDYLEISELQFISNGQVISAGLPYVYSNPATGDLPVSQVLSDGSSSTRVYWHSSVVNSTGFYIYVDFGQPVSVTGIRQAGYDNPNRYMRSFLLESSSDGLTWKPRGRKSNLLYPGNYTLSDEYIIDSSTTRQHRYWRLKDISVNISILELAEIHLYSQDVRVDEGATLSVSVPDYTGNPVNSLKDGILSSILSWDTVDVQTPSFYITWDFTTPVEVTALKQGLHSELSYMTGFTIQWSDDGVTWNDHDTLSNIVIQDTMTMSDYISFYNHKVYSNWRINVSQNDGDGSYVSFSELGLFLSNNGTGTNLCLGNNGTAQQSGNGVVGPAADGADNTITSECGSNLPLPYWWSINLGSNRYVGSMKLTSQRVVTGRTPRAFKLQAKNYTSNTWNTVMSITGSSGWAVFEERLFIIP